MMVIIDLKPTKQAVCYELTSPLSENREQAAFAVFEVQKRSKKFSRLSKTKIN